MALKFYLDTYSYVSVMIRFIASVIGKMYWKIQMTDADTPVQKILNRHGISDAVKFIDEAQKSAEFGYSKDPSIRVTGNIQLMKRRFVTREIVARILKKLRWF